MRPEGGRGGTIACRKGSCRLSLQQVHGRHATYYVLRHHRLLGVEGVLERRHCCVSCYLRACEPFPLAGTSILVAFVVGNNCEPVWARIVTWCRSAGRRGGLRRGRWRALLSFCSNINGLSSRLPMYFQPCVYIWFTTSASPEPTFFIFPLFIN